MRNITRTALALAGSAALVGVTAMSASAEDTPVTVTVEAGSLAIAVPQAATLDTADVAPGADSTVRLGATTVTDERAGEAGWTVSVNLPDLTDGEVAPKLIPTNVATYLADTVVVGDTTGGVTVTASAELTGLDAAAQVSQTATTVSGNNTATWGALLTVPIPAQALADTYTGVLTQSVL